MGLGLALALAAALGIIAVRLLRGADDEWFLDLFLGVGCGLGMTSAAWFVWLVLFDPPGTSLLMVEAAALVGLALLLVVRRRPANSSPQGIDGRPPRLLLAALVVIVGSSLVAFVVTFLGEPHGHWDAAQIWNLRARFFVRGGEHWRDAFALNFPGTHADYPLLLPVSVARCWNIIGNETPLAPATIALLFTLATAGALGALVGALRGATAGVLAALALLGTSTFIRVGLGQIADVPLGFYILAAVGLVCLHDRTGDGRPGELMLAGLMAGFAAWTKNEGLLFLVCFFGAWLFTRLRGPGVKQTIQELAYLLIGLLPAALLLAYFKIVLAPPNDLVEGQAAQSLVKRLTDPARYATIGSAFLWELLYIGPGAVVVLGAALVLLGRVPRESRPSAALPGLVTALMLLGYFAVYATTPYDVYWHLRTSLHRLYMQLWPLALLWYFLTVATPKEAAARTARRAGKA
jgi:Dolichyl-phosphate-mannose-protein mannosyltransferase